METGAVRWFDKPLIRWLVFVAALVPIFVPLIIILRFGTNMPYWDEWFPDMAGIYIKAHACRLNGVVEIGLQSAMPPR